MEPLAVRFSRPLYYPSTTLRLYLRPASCVETRPVPIRRRPTRLDGRHSSSRATTQGTKKNRTPFRLPHASSGSAARYIHSDELKSIRSQAESIFRHPALPSEQETLKPLKAIENAARTITGSSTTEEGSKNAKSTREDPASALLSLDVESKPPKSKYGTDTANTLSTLAYDIIKHPTVFITADILSAYVRIQALLQRSSSFPEIFSLYADKPIPTTTRNTPTTPSNHRQTPASQVIYKSSSPNALSVAVPKPVATLALKTAIANKDLATTLDIIEKTFATPPFKRAKIVRRALPPLTATAILPLAAYKLAAEMATYQIGVPAEDFTAYAFAGMLAYAGAVGMMGYVALTTSNDQMQRVTWAIGMPLWERWVREDERAACDLVALAWGFREKYRWGEETGAEWEELKEYLGRRAMVLDKVSLMEGME